MKTDQTTTTRRWNINCLLIALLFSTIMQAQQNALQWNIYFETASHALTPANKQLLEEIAGSLKTYDTYIAYLSGHTDEVGNISYNQVLSEKRLEAVIHYLAAHGVLANNLQTEANGETKPIADNRSEEGRRQNRRVAIAIYPIKKETITEHKKEVERPLEPIAKLYGLLEKPSAIFCINPEMDTVLKCPEGTLLYVKANTFPSAGRCKNKCVSLKIKEVFEYSDMLMENLSTTSDGRLLETYGMIKTEAEDCEGNKLSMPEDSNLVLFVPTDNHPTGLKIFAGEWGENGSINWVTDETAPFEFSTFLFANYIYGSGPILARCPLFFCKIMRFFGFRDWQEKSYATTETPNNAQQELMALQDKYGIQDLNKLAEAMGLDVKNITTESLVTEDKKQKISHGTATIDDYKYFVFNTPKLDWRNCDVFMDLKPNMLATMQVDLKPMKNVDCKLVFRKRQALVPANPEGEVHSFVNIPKNESAWLVALKYENGTPFLSMQEVRTGEKKIQPMDFKAVTIGEMKEQLRRLDI